MRYRRCTTACGWPATTRLSWPREQTAGRRPAPRLWTWTGQSSDEERGHLIGAVHCCTAPVQAKQPGQGMPGLRPLSGLHLPYTDAVIPAVHPLAVHPPYTAVPCRTDLTLTSVQTCRTPLRTGTLPSELSQSVQLWPVMAITLLNRPWTSPYPPVVHLPYTLPHRWVRYSSGRFGTFWPTLVQTVGSGHLTLPLPTDRDRYVTCCTLSDNRQSVRY